MNRHLGLSKNLGVHRNCQFQRESEVFPQSHFQTKQLLVEGKSPWVAPKISTWDTMGLGENPSISASEGEPQPQPPLCWSRTPASQRGAIGGFSHDFEGVPTIQVILLVVDFTTVWKKIRDYVRYFTKFHIYEIRWMVDRPTHRTP